MSLSAKMIAQDVWLSALIAVVGLLAPLSVWIQPRYQAPDIAVITSPTEGQSINGLVTVTGSANHPDFDRYEIAYGPDPNPNDAWQVFGMGTQPVDNGALGTWNTAVVPDGGYMLRLRVVRKDSNYSEAVVRGLQVSNSAPAGTPTSIPPAATFPAEQPTFNPEEAAQPTKLIIVEQPPTSVPAPTAADNIRPTATPRRANAAASIFNGELFGTACLSGIVLAVTAFTAVGIIQFGRYGYKQIRRQARKKH